jgi:hypothetical protein
MAQEQEISGSQNAKYIAASDATVKQAENELSYAKNISAEIQSCIEKGISE